MGERDADLPTMALSIRQPWAFTIVARWKNVENRSWRAPNPGLTFRGPVAIHASGGMTRAEYDDCADLCNELGFTLPPPDRLPRGGIVGTATVTDIVKQFDSPWFFGPRGLILADARPVDFIAVGGRLGFFDWRQLLPLATTNEPAQPARWMLPVEQRKPKISPRQARDRLRYEQAMIASIGRPLPNREDAG